MQTLQHIGIKFYGIVNDLGHVQGYDSSNFQTLDEFRNSRLNELLDN